MEIRKNRATGKLIVLALRSRRRPLPSMHLLTSLEMELIGVGGIPSWRSSHRWHWFWRWKCCCTFAFSSFNLLACARKTAFFPPPPWFNSSIKYSSSDWRFGSIWGFWNHKHIDSALTCYIVFTHGIRHEADCTSCNTSISICKTLH